MGKLLRCFVFTENRLHLSPTQTYRFGSALGLHGFSRFGLSHEPQCKPNAEGKFYLHAAEAKPALAAEQQQYAPLFSLSAPCILPILMHR